MTTQERWGTAFLVRHRDRYFVNNDNGDLIIAQFTPDGYVELDRTKLIEADGTAGIGAGPARRWDPRDQLDAPGLCQPARHPAEQQRDPAGLAGRERLLNANTEPEQRRPRPSQEDP